MTIACALVLPPQKYRKPGTHCGVLFFSDSRFMRGNRVESDVGSKFHELAPRTCTVFAGTIAPAEAAFDQTRVELFRRSSSSANSLTPPDVGRLLRQALTDHWPPGGDPSKRLLVRVGMVSRKGVPTVIRLNSAEGFEPHFERSGLHPVGVQAAINELKKVFAEALAPADGDRIRPSEHSAREWAMYLASMLRRRILTAGGTAVGGPAQLWSIRSDSERPTGYMVGAGVFDAAEQEIPLFTLKPGEARRLGSMADAEAAAGDTVLEGPSFDF